MKGIEMKNKTGYMCGTAYYHDLEGAVTGTKIYPTLEDLKEYDCTESYCGVAQVEIKLVKWIKEPSKHLKEIK